MKHTKGQQSTLQAGVKDDVTEDVVNLSIKEEGVSQVDLEQTAFQTLKGKGGRSPGSRGERRKACLPQLGQSGGSEGKRGQPRDKGKSETYTGKTRFSTARMGSHRGTVSRPKA